MNIYIKKNTKNTFYDLLLFSYFFSTISVKYLVSSESEYYIIKYDYKSSLSNKSHKGL